MTSGTHVRRPFRLRGPVRTEHGFTLVEVLVALVIMAILATLAWQGLDGIVRSRDAGRLAMDRSVRIATVLGQWEQDLQAVVDTQVVPAINFDGQTLRLTRRSDAGIVLVAWSVRLNRWQRWAGPASVRVADLREAWLRSQQLLGNESSQLTVLEAVSTWQVYFWRGNEWSNAQSTGDLILPATPTPTPTPAPAAAPASGASAPDATAVAAAAAASAPAAAARERLPDAVRMVLTVNGQTLTRDITLGTLAP